MARTTPQMKSTMELRERSLAVIADLEAKLAMERVRLAAFDEALCAMRGEPVISLEADKPAGRLRNTKKTVLDIISEAGSAGVVASEIVKVAASRGREVKAGSVSSLLSKLKADGVLRFDGDRYYPATTSTPAPTGLKIVAG